MIHRKRIRALARSSVAVFITAALGACSASTYPAPTAQSPVSPTRQSASHARRAQTRSAYNDFRKDGP